MAKKKNGFDTTALMKYAERLEEAGGHAAITRAVTAGLVKTKQHINKEIEKRLVKAKLPAKGKYSDGDTLKNLDRDLRVIVTGNIVSINLGWDEEKGTPVHAFLLYGTPKMKPVAGLNNALKGKTARAKLIADQEEAMQKILERLGG